MDSWFKKIFQTKEQSYIAEVPESTSATFYLSFKKIQVGILILKNGIWEFQYSDEFKKQDQILALVNFPDKYKIYKSDDLFPFFVLRIPGEGQLKAKGIDITKKAYSNPVNLLNWYGKKNIANPYILEMA